MESIGNFFRWWFGELRSAFSGRQGPTLALMLTDQEIALVERNAEGEAQLGVAPLNAPDRRERIESLRSIAERRSGETVELRLPLGQVFFLDLPGGTAASEEIARVAAKRIGRPVADLAVDIVHGRQDGRPVHHVAGTLRATLAEALRYAREWGFDPVRITSVEWPAHFANGPELYLRRTRERSPVLRRVSLALGVLALAICLAAGGRALATRSSIAAEESRAANSAPMPFFTRSDTMRKLVAYTDAAATAVDARTERMAYWRLIAEIAKILPEDIALDSIAFEGDSVRLTGTGYALDLLLVALDRSPYFVGPRIEETGVRGRASASFDIVARAAMGDAQ